MSQNDVIFSGKKSWSTDLSKEGVLGRGRVGERRKFAGDSGELGKLSYIVIPSYFEENIAKNTNN